MLGGRSFQLGRIFGIRIGASASWFVVLFLLIASFSSQYRTQFPGQDTKAFILATITAASFLLSILLHELGHAFAARASGIGVPGVELWVFGGFTSMDREPPTPKIALRVAAAGPLATLAITIVTYVGATLSGSSPFGTSLGNPGTGPAASIFGYLAWINAVLLAFNLLPGLPLDGGRIAQALIWWRTDDRARATRATSRLGRGLAYVLGAIALLVLVSGNLITGVWLGFIAWIISQGARQLEAQTTLTGPIAGLRVADVMDTEPVTMPAQTRLDRALEDFFLRYRWDWFPVVDAMGHFLGLVSRDKVEAVPEALRAGSSVDEVTTMDTRSAFRIGIDEPLETLLGSEPMRRLGALMAVDDGGVLRGVVTIEQVRRALQPVSSGA